MILGFPALFLIIKYQSSIKEAWLFNLEKVKIYFDNFFSDSDAQTARRRPLSLAERETELKLYIGEPFKDFTPADWNEFWNLIYGRFSKENPDRQSLPKKMRQLTLDEIAYELMYRYPQPFAYFTESHWKIFFSIIAKK